MKRRLADGGGYLSIDHRDSPGVRSEDVAHLPGAVAVGAGQHFETDVYQCSHCQRTVVLQLTKGREHLRGYCPSCDHYVCNACEAIRVVAGCVPFKARLDAASAVADRAIAAPDNPEHDVDLVLTDGWRR